MGIHGFSSTFTKTTEINISETKNQDFGIDAFIQVFRNASKQHIAGLTNSKGESTLHINVALQNIIKRILLKGDDIWCFDSRDPRKVDDPKQFVLNKRAEQRDIRAEESKILDDEIKKLEMLESKTTKEKIIALDAKFYDKLDEKRLKLASLENQKDTGMYFAPMVRDIQFILKCLGVTIAIAPSGVDAEKALALMSQLNMIDAVLTTDTDTLLYGAKKILKQKKSVPGQQPRVKPGTYDVYVLEDCLKQHKLTQDDLIKVGIILGSDFADKTHGVGAGTVIKKFKEIKLTEEQMKAVEIFKVPIKIEDIEFIRNDYDLVSIKKLEDWLIKEQNFKTERVEKMLEPLKEIYRKDHPS